MATFGISGKRSRWQVAGGRALVPGSREKGKLSRR
jgi:hypothetical protein